MGVWMTNWLCTDAISSLGSKYPLSSEVRASAAPLAQLVHFFALQVGQEQAVSTLSWGSEKRQMKRPIPKEETLFQIIEFSLQEVIRRVGRVDGQRSPQEGKGLST